MSDICNARRCKNPAVPKLVVCLEHADLEALRLIGREDLVKEKRMDEARQALWVAKTNESTAVMTLERCARERLMAERELRERERT